MQVRLLGVLEVIEDDGAVIVLRGTKLRRLVAILALQAGRVVSTDRLLEDLYGDDPPQTASNALQVLVSKLRRALAAGHSSAAPLVTRAPGYLLEVEAANVDAMHFGALVAEGRSHLESERMAEASAVLVEALGLWRGAALVEFEYDNFATSERLRLDELRISATEDRIEADLQLGRHVDCSGELKTLVTAHPLRERAWAQLILALYRCGRQAEALRAFQQARTMLGKELGIEPGTELRRLETDILSHSPGLELTAEGAPQLRRRGNIDLPLTACLGREAQLRTIGDLLGRHRLVTLVGPGGVGKTRLAVELGLARSDDHDASAWMAELTVVSAPEGVVPAIRGALGLNAPPMGAAAGTDHWTDPLSDRALLVVLDNCEHVVTAAASAAVDLLKHCPNVRILATSREGLGIPGEVLYDVPPLGAEAAARLFAERATAAAPGLVLDEAARAAVGDICRRLDGLPLGIELAAARARALDVTQIATRLGDRFRLLAGGPRTVLPRQRTLRAVVDWSYDLLETSERVVFERISVFSGGFTMEAAEVVCADERIDGDEIADGVCRLVEKSLLVVARHPGGTRYSMLQTLAEYARERLTETDADAMRRRHAAWVSSVVEGAERGAGRVPTVGMAALVAETENIDAAVAWATVHDPALALCLSARLGWFTFWMGRIEVGWRSLSAGLERLLDVPAPLRARATAWAGILGILMGQPEGPSLVEAGVKLGRGCGDRFALGQALGIRGALAVLSGHPKAAVPDLTEAAACYASDDLHGQAMIEMLQGVAAMTEGRFAEADEFYRRSVEHFGSAGDEWAEGISLQRLAELAERQGRFDDAAAALEALVVKTLDLPNFFFKAVIQAQLASARLGQGRVEEAAALADEAVERAKDYSHTLAVAVANHVRGRIALRQGRLDMARPDLELALGRYLTQANHAAASTCLGDLGRIAAAVGEPHRAVTLHAGSAREAIIASDQMMTVSALEGLARALAGVGDGSRAGLLLGASDERRDAGARPWDPNVDDRAAAEAATHEILGSDRLAAARHAGRSTPVDQLLAGLGVV